VYKYNASGVYQNVSFSILAQETYPQGLTWDGTYFYVIGTGNNSFLKYSADGTFIANVISVYPQESSIQGILAVGTDLWAIGLNSDTAHKYQAQIGTTSVTANGGQNYMRIK